MRTETEEVVVLVGGPLDGAGWVVHSSRIRSIRVRVASTVHTYERTKRVDGERARFVHVRVR